MNIALATLVIIAAYAIAYFATVFIAGAIAHGITILAIKRAWKGLTKEECLDRIKKWRPLAWKMELLFLLAIIVALIYKLTTNPNYQLPLHVVLLALAITTIPDNITAAMQRYYKNNYKEECLTSV
jgi:branched-subunit amino acid ABC-type transport system permease component